MRVAAVVQRAGIVLDTRGAVTGPAPAVEIPDGSADEAPARSVFGGLDGPSPSAFNGDGELHASERPCSSITRPSVDACGLCNTCSRATHDRASASGSMHRRHDSSIQHLHRRIDCTSEAAGPHQHHRRRASESDLETLGSQHRL